MSFFMVNSLAKGPVTLELRSSRLSRAQKILPSVARAWPITVFAPIPRQQYVVSAFLLRPTSIHHAPYHAQHHARITLELRPLRLYRDQSDRVACKRRFYYTPKQRLPRLNYAPITFLVRLDQDLITANCAGDDHI